MIKDEERSIEERLKKARRIQKEINEIDRILIASSNTPAEFKIYIHTPGDRWFGDSLGDITNSELKSAVVDTLVKRRSLLEKEYELL